MIGSPGRFTRPGGVFCLRPMPAETCNFPTKISTKFLSVLSYEFHQARSKLSSLFAIDWRQHYDSARISAATVARFVRRLA